MENSEDAPSSTTSVPSTEDPVVDSSDLGATPDEGGSVRRSTRDIRRPKFDDEIVDSPFFSPAYSGILKSSPNKRKSTDHAASITPERGRSLSWGKASTSAMMTSLSEGGDAGEQEPMEEGNSTTTTTTAAAAIPSTEDQPCSSTSVNGAPAEENGGGSSRSLRKRGVPKAPDYESILAATQYAEEQRKKESRIASKDLRSKEVIAATHAGDAALVDYLGKWTAEDEVLLLNSATHVCDLAILPQIAKFSRPYTVEEVVQRWYDLLYDENLSRLAKKRWAAMTWDQLDKIAKMTPYSLAEEDILCDVDTSQLDPSQYLQTMENLLTEYPTIFHGSRTPVCLRDHHHILKMAGLTGTKRNMCPPIDLTRMEHESILAADTSLDEARLMRGSLETTRVVSQRVAGVSRDAFDEGAVAILRGRLAKYIIRVDRVMLGRSTKTEQVDINLALEAPAQVIARKQAVLTRDPKSGTFMLQNIARRPIAVDGRVLNEGNYTMLPNNSVIEMAHIRLVFKCL